MKVILGGIIQAKICGEEGMVCQTFHFLRYRSKTRQTQSALKECTSRRGELIYYLAMVSIIVKCKGTEHSLRSQGRLPRGPDVQAQG